MKVSVHVTLPKKDLTKKKWLDSIASKQRAQTLPIMRKLFQKTVFGWSQKPDFSWSQTKSSDRITLSMYPTGPASDKWSLLNAGAPAHRIDARNGFFLSFRPGYRAATRPGTLQSSRAYRSGKKILVNHVNHPGFEARKFTELIVEGFADQYTRDMQDAINEVVRR